MPGPFSSSETITKPGIRKRSFLCRIVLSMAMTYFLILTLLFIAGLFYSNTITVTISRYAGQNGYEPYSFYWFVAIGAFLYLTASAGIFLFILNRKRGFFLFISAALIILVLDFIFLEFDWVRYLIHSGIIFLMGIAYFSKRCFSWQVPKSPKAQDYP